MAASSPGPAPDGDSLLYWEGVARGELRIQRCMACGRHVFYPRALCPHCHADALEWVTAAGTGTIYSYTVVHQAFGHFAEQAPFVVAIVELDEGVRMMTRIVGSAPDAVAIGARVRVVFQQAPEGVTLPYFQLVGAAP